MKMLLRTTAIAGIIGVGAVLMTSPAEAATATATIAVTANVINNCTIGTTPLAHGNYDALAGAPNDTTAVVTITCTAGAITSIDIDAGAHFLGAVRRLANGGGQFLTYEIYQDAGYSVIWGAGVGNNVVPAAAPDTNPRPFTAYGRIAPTQSVPAGAYADTVTATVNF